MVFDKGMNIPSIWMVVLRGNKLERSTASTRRVEPFIMHVIGKAGEEHVKLVLFENCKKFVKV